MFFIRMRTRDPWKLSTVIFASGTPRKVTSSRSRVAGQRPARVVQDPAARGDLLDVALVGRRVHRDDQVEAGGARGVAPRVGADLVPGRQSLDVRREEVLPRHGDPHPEDRAAQQAVGAGRPGPVDRADLEGEVVDPARGRAAVGARGNLAGTRSRGVRARRPAWCSPGSAGDESAISRSRPPPAPPDPPAPPKAGSDGSRLPPDPAYGTSRSDCACPTPPSGSARRTVRSECRGPRP